MVVSLMRMRLGTMATSGLIRVSFDEYCLFLAHLTPSNRQGLGQQSGKILGC
jgi:hypothetical protein